MVPQRLIPSIRAALRLRHFSARTERAYVFWARRFVLFGDRRDPRECGEREVVAFLDHLVATRQIAASTQNQAVAALSFLYRDVLGRPLAALPAIARGPRALCVCRTCWSRRRSSGCCASCVVRRVWW